MRVLLVVAALLSADGGSEQSRLDEARVRWADQALVDHTFRVQRSCFCRREYTRAYTMYVRRGEPYEPVRYVNEYATVTRLFAVVQKAIDGDGTVEVEYGPTGAPTRISLDPIPMAIDDESTITVSKPREDFTVDVPALTIRDGSAARELREARARWAGRGLRDYRYRVRARSQVYVEPYTAVVRDGDPVDKGPSVLQLFRLIRAAIRNDDVVLRVRYTTSGQPRVIRGNDRYSISDGQYRIVTSRARPL